MVLIIPLGLAVLVPICGILWALIASRFDSSIIWHDGRDYQNHKL